MKILINYANKKYYNSQKNNSKSGLEIGGFDKVYQYSYDDIDEKFKTENKKILSENRGAGYWLWKPYFILKTLEKIKDDDIIFYCDSGCSFVDNFNKTDLFDLCFNDEKGLILFDAHYMNKDYTKKDCFYYMNCDEEKYTNGSQLVASFQLVRKTDFTINFYKEHIKYAKDYRIITDVPNECGLENYGSFLDHRHDQSILSLLAIKHNLSIQEDISQYGDIYREEGSIRLINHHRNKK